MKRCLITGATGLIGKALCRLLRDEWETYTIGINDENTTYIDLSTEFSIDILPKKVDAIIHLAQSIHFREFPDHADNIFKINVMSTMKLLEYARKMNVSTFVLASSGGIYGDGDQGFKEDEIITTKNDLGFYLSTKLCSEVLAENYSSFMNVIMLRFFFVYGPNQRIDMLIPRLVKSVFDEHPIILNGQDGIRINPTYVTDAARAVYLSLNLEGSHKINVGGPEILSLRQIGDIIGKVLNKKPNYCINESISPKNLIGDIEKLTNLLWKPQVSFEEGIKLYADNLSQKMRSNS